jgi:uncharacterized protein (TIGR02271 family)
MTEDRDTIAVTEERLDLQKRRVVTGGVRLRTETQSHDELVSAELNGESVEVTRVPVDCEVTTPPDIRHEGGVTIVPVLEERLVVEKRLVLVEEIHLRRKPTQERVEIPVTLRRQNVVVEQIDPDKPTEPEGT